VLAMTSGHPAPDGFPHRTGRVSWWFENHPVAEVGAAQTNRVAVLHDLAALDIKEITTLMYRVDGTRHSGQPCASGSGRQELFAVHIGS
jgi:hypothetical protein